MKCDFSREKLVAYFYEEMDAESRHELEAHLTECAACRAELAGFKNTTRLLKMWPDEEPGLNLRIAEPAGSRERLAAFSWQRLVFGLAIACAVLVMLAALDFRADYNAGRFSLQLSLFSAEEPPPTLPADSAARPLTRGEFREWQQETHDLVNRLIRDSELRQQQQYEAKLARLATEIESQRRRDLKFVGRGLEAFQMSNEDQLRKTNEVLQHLILTAAQQDLAPGMQPGR